jgi:hypothetical protein
MKGSPMLHCISSKVENQIFMNKKCYRMYIWHINKVGSTHFVGGNATFVLAK